MPLQRLQHKFSNKQVGVTDIVFNSSINAVEKNVYFKETDITGSWLQKQARYSWDNSLWTPWFTLTQQSLINIAFNNRPSFWLEVKYTRADFRSAEIGDWYLFYDSYATTPSSSDDTIIDADLLQGQPGTYYLDGANQYGPVPNLHVENIWNPDNSIGGVYSHKVDASNNTTLFLRSIEGEYGISVRDDSTNNTIVISADVSVLNTASNIGDGDASIYYGSDQGNLQFREIAGSDQIIVSVSDNLLEIDASISVNYDTTLDPTLEMPNTVGGISAGTAVSDISGDTLISMWDNLLFPTINPTYTNPSITFIENVSNLQEIDDDVAVTFTCSYDAGDILINGTPQNDRGGSPNTYTYTGTGLTTPVSSSSSSNAQTPTHTFIVGLNTWTAYVSYDQGPQPYDNKGNPVDSPLSAGNTSTTTINLEGVDPIYANSVNINTYTKQTLVSMLYGNNVQINLVAEAGGKQSFEIPTRWVETPTNRPLTGILTYNSVSSSWEYQGGSASSSLTFWTSARVTEGTVNYIRLIYNSDNRDAVQIRLVF
jgi:hypothetical protein